ncbi:hypothetical protein VMCG_05532 [Cytospora schulzeri]|uniref:Uncharacterized protein n=1 Tax=Cytospora schulzeri TaxID=448051 RepID=A0A423WEX0_9PEZI|nr:hypothetical protein VMCG_05532 [Valsa malicola]
MEQMTLVSEVSPMDMNITAHRARRPTIRDPFGLDKDLKEPFSSVPLGSCSTSIWEMISRVVAWGDDWSSMAFPSCVAGQQGDLAQAYVQDELFDQQGN